MGLNKIAIIGAGISGLTLASKLKNNFEVTVFEQNSKPGGRCSSIDVKGSIFDHGAQCFTIRDVEFEKFINPYLQQNLVQEWTGRVINVNYDSSVTERIWQERHFVFSPHMSSVIEKISLDVNVLYNYEIIKIEKNISKWSLFAQQGFCGEFDMVIFATSANVIFSLIYDYVKYNNSLAHLNMQPCYSVMLSFDQKLEINWIAAKILRSPVKWIYDISTKPGRDNSCSNLVIHSKSNWAKKNFALEAAQNLLLSEVIRLFPEMSNYKEIYTYFWQDALVAHSNRPGYFIDEKLMLAGTSDWAASSRIEESFLSANNLASLIMQKF